MRFSAGTRLTGQAPVKPVGARSLLFMRGLVARR
jgi:hypothetical protein